MSGLAVVDTATGEYFPVGEVSFSELQQDIVSAIRDGEDAIWRVGKDLAVARAMCEDAQRCLAEGIAGKNGNERFSKFVADIMSETKTTVRSLWRYRRLFEEFGEQRLLADHVGVTGCYELVKEEYAPVLGEVKQILSDYCEQKKAIKAADVKALAKEALRNHKARLRQGISAPTGCEITVGDCVELVRNMTEAPHVVIADPPYGVDVHNTRTGSKDYPDGKEYALSLLDLLAAALAEKCDKDAHLYFFSGYTLAWEFRQVLSKHFDVQKNPIIWVKDNHTMCDFSQWYPNKHEYVWFCKQRGSRRQLLKCVPDVITCKRQNDTDHSAEKPVDLLKIFIEQSSASGEVILDPFVGSGSTGVAALQLDRSFIGFDISDEWAGVARERCRHARD